MLLYKRFNLSYSWISRRTCSFYMAAKKAGCKFFTFSRFEKNILTFPNFSSRVQVRLMWCVIAQEKGNYLTRNAQLRKPSLILPPNSLSFWHGTLIIIVLSALSLRYIRAQIYFSFSRIFVFSDKYKIKLKFQNPTLFKAEWTSLTMCFIWPGLHFLKITERLEDLHQSLNLRTSA